MKSLVTILLSLLATAAHAASPRPAGVASCAASPSDASACYVSWSWDQPPRPYQYVQTLDPSNGHWRAVQETAAARNGRSLDTVAPGNLYRVVSCNDPQDAATCIGTSVFWALLRPPVDEIPPKIVDERGGVWSVPKNLPYEIQLGVLNQVYQFAYFQHTDWSQMPPMTRPARRWNARSFQLIDSVTNHIYDAYEQSRLPRDRPAADATTAAAPRTPVEWIGDVPAEEHAQFRAGRLHGGFVDQEVIEFGPSDPKYTVTVFADVACQHCARLTRDLDALAAMGIRVRFLAYPLRGPYSAEGRAMTNVWCASPKDRPDALRRAMLGEVIPSSDCNSESVTYQYALAKRLGLMGSPNIIADNGEVIGGYLTPEQLLARLQAPATTQSK
jgi:Thioredoxin-like domain